MSEFFDPNLFRENAYAIADAGSVDRLPDGLVTSRLVPKLLASSAHLMPTLIDLKQSSVSRRDALFSLIQHCDENEGAPPVALFINTGVTSAAISRHWNAMQLVHPRPGDRLWLRLHDPRVLHQLLRILHPMQCLKLFGLALAFTYWVGGEWVTVGRDMYDLSSPKSSGRCGVEPYGGPERWDWFRIERIALVNRALGAARIRGAASLISAGAVAEQLMERATAGYSLVDDADLVEFALRGLTICPAFDEHPLIASAISFDTSSTERLSLSDRLALVENTVWNAARQPQ